MFTKLKETVHYVQEQGIASNIPKKQQLFYWSISVLTIGLIIKVLRRSISMIENFD